MTKTIVVDHQNVEAAKAVIEIAGGPDHVDPLIVKIAAAKPASAATADAVRPEVRRNTRVRPRVDLPCASRSGPTSSARGATSASGTWRRRSTRSSTRDDVEVVYRSFELDPSAPEVPVETTVESLAKKFGTDVAGRP